MIYEIPLQEYDDQHVQKRTVESRCGMKRHYKQKKTSRRRRNVVVGGAMGSLMLQYEMFEQAIQNLLVLFVTSMIHHWVREL